MCGFDGEKYRDKILKERGACEREKKDAEEIKHLMKREMGWGDAKRSLKSDGGPNKTTKHLMKRGKEGKNLTENNGGPDSTWSHVSSLHWAGAR